MSDEWEISTQNTDGENAWEIQINFEDVRNRRHRRWLIKDLAITITAGLVIGAGVWSGLSRLLTTESAQGILTENFTDFDLGIGDQLTIESQCKGVARALSGQRIFMLPTDKISRTNSVPIPTDQGCK